MRCNSSGRENWDVNKKESSWLIINALEVLYACSYRSHTALIAPSMVALWLLYGCSMLALYSLYTLSILSLYHKT